MLDVEMDSVLHMFLRVRERESNCNSERENVYVIN